MCGNRKIHIDIEESIVNILKILKIPKLEKTQLGFLNFNVVAKALNYKELLFVFCFMFLAILIFSMHFH